MRWKTMAIGTAALFVLSANVLACANDTRVDPSEIYHDAWRIVNEKYYDATYNAQNWGRWKHRYDDKLLNEEAASKAIDTMLASLGNRACYVPNWHFETLCGFGIPAGICAQIGIAKSGRPCIIAPIAGGPAATAGIRRGDEIIRVNDKPVPNGASALDVTKVIRGESGTPVSVTVQRESGRFRFNLVRSRIPFDETEIRLTDNQIAYVKLKSLMSMRCDEQLRAGLNKLRDAKGIILDLRDNPGGLFSNAIEICSAFVQEGTVVYSVNRDRKAEAAYCSKSAQTNEPLVVLVNSGTAGAAEILAAALHANGRGEIVGQKTFAGKGLVTTVERLNDGAIILPIQRYVSPDNKDITDGVIPDYLVDSDDAQVAKAIELIRSKLPA
jgi:carboxyl-terminal processing protease